MISTQERPVIDAPSGDGILPGSRISMTSLKAMMTELEAHNTAHPPRFTPIKFAVESTVAKPQLAQKSYVQARWGEPETRKHVRHETYRQRAGELAINAANTLLAPVKRLASIAISGIVGVVESKRAAREERDQAEIKAIADQRAARMNARIAELKGSTPKGQSAYRPAHTRHSARRATPVVV